MGEKLKKEGYAFIACGVLALYIFLMLDMYLEARIFIIVGICFACLLLPMGICWLVAGLISQERKSKRFKHIIIEADTLDELRSKIDDFGNEYWDLVNFTYTESELPMPWAALMKKELKSKG